MYVCSFHSLDAFLFIMQAPISTAASSHTLQGLHGHNAVAPHHLHNAHVIMPKNFQLVRHRCKSSCNEILHHAHMLSVL